MPKNDKRMQILAAAEKLFTDKRYHELTLDDVAREAQVGKGTIYLYFKSKDDLVVHLAMHGHAALCALIREIIDRREHDFEERLVHVCAKVSEFMVGHHTLFRIMQEEEMLSPSLVHENRSQLEGGRLELQGLVVTILRDGQAQGRLRNDIDLELQAESLMEMMRVRDWYPETPGRPSIRQLIDVFIHGFRARN